MDLILVTDIVFLPSILNPLIPKSAESPCPPGNMYSVGCVNRMLPTTSEVCMRSVTWAGTSMGDR